MEIESVQVIINPLVFGAPSSHQFSEFRQVTIYIFNWEGLSRGEFCLMSDVELAIFRKRTFFHSMFAKTVSVPKLVILIAVPLEVS